jgi:glycosyltransferase involved in cell wall biosynthesis
MNQHSVSSRLHIVYIGLVDWDHMRERSQHLALELSRYHKVLYVWQASPVASLWYRLPLPPRYLVINENLQILRPRVLPFHKYSPIMAVNQRLMLRAIRSHLPLEEVDVLWLSHPWDYGYCQRLKAPLACYDYMDNIPLLWPAPNLALLEERLLQTADLVFVTSRSLQRRALALASQVVLVPNAVEFSHFARAATEPLPIPVDLAGIPRPRIGFYGTFGHWIDLELIEHLASACPHWSYVFIGLFEVPKSDLEALRRLRNVHFLGVRDYCNLPAYLQHVDVWWLPFRRNELTVDVDPLKVYEYLAAGKPVVVTRLPEIEKFAPFVGLATGEDEFRVKIEAFLNRTDSEEHVRARMAFAAQNTWEERGRRIVEAIEMALRDKKVLREAHETDALSMIIGGIDGAK